MAKNHAFRGYIINALKHNKDGSFNTQADRSKTLKRLDKELGSLGYDKVTAKNFGGRHVVALVDSWKLVGLSDATIKNRMSHMRWLVEKMDKASCIPRTNKELGIDQRKYSNNSENKAKEIDQDKLQQLTERQQLSIQLQRSFGLRREESLKFQPKLADKGDKLELKASWCKGGRAREIPIRTEAQRDLLDQCRKVAGSDSMINSTQSYIQGREALDKACQKYEIRNMHGFRHAYAQERYKDLTGRDCPKAGGIKSKELTKEEKEKDFEARMKISHELGHGREEITVRYLGR